MPKKILFLNEMEGKLSAVVTSMSMGLLNSVSEFKGSYSHTSRLKELLILQKILGSLGLKKFIQV